MGYRLLLCVVGALFLAFLARTIVEAYTEVYLRQLVTELKNEAQKP